MRQGRVLERVAVSAYTGDICPPHGSLQSPHCQAGSLRAPHTDGLKAGLQEWWPLILLCSL